MSGFVLGIGKVAINQTVKKTLPLYVWSKGKYKGISNVPNNNQWREKWGYEGQNRIRVDGGGEGGRTEV